MTRAFLLAAAALALVQLLARPRSDEIPFDAHYIFSLAAGVLFLCGMAFAARGMEFSPWAQVLPAMGGAALVLFVVPRAKLPPKAELAVFLLGALALAAAAVWLALRYWGRARFAAMLVGAGGVMGAAVFLRAGLVRYGQYTEPLAMWLPGTAIWSLELTRLFTLANLLLFAGGVVSMPYHLLVDDNFHYMDEDEGYEGDSYATRFAAVSAARAMVDDYLRSEYKPGMKAGDLFEIYTLFGEDPFIISDTDADVPFSAIDYARRRCEDLCR